MSAAIVSPNRTPASNPAATVSISASLMMISTLTSGKFLRKRVTIGSSTSCVDCRAALKRSVPAGLPRKLLRSSSASSISRNAGLIRENSRSPASVSATLRVVRLISRRSSRSSMLRSAWLSADADTPSSVAAARKLRCRAIARKVARSDGSIRIDEFFSVACELFSGLSQLWRAAIPCPSGSANPLGHNGKGKNMRVWFITGASRGFGALIAEAALKSGDAVVATARDPNTVIRAPRRP